MRTTETRDGQNAAETSTLLAPISSTKSHSIVISLVDHSLRACFSKRISDHLLFGAMNIRYPYSVFIIEN